VSTEDLAALIAEGVVEPVRVDREAARRDLDAAAAHLRAAEEIASIDATGAFALAYDGMRKAISAHMRVSGVRVTNRPGAHARSGRYARSVLAAREIDEHLRAFDDLRRVRNKTEYDALLVTEATARDALTHSHAILEAVEADLS
jgi:hypothetical protein